MKRITAAMLASVCAFVTSASADTNGAYTISVNSAIADGNPVGLVSSTNLSGLPTGIASVQADLNITGGFNGDLFAYLVGPNGGFAALLNRVGLSASNPFGYGRAGFNITLGDGFLNIHNYQSGGYTIADGQLINSWSPDGRNINPQSSGSVFDAASTSSGFGVYNLANPNGQRMLFGADLAGGDGASTLVSWGLTIAIPEPQTWAMLISGGAMLLALRRRR